jgi:hypothetical protein
MDLQLYLRVLWRFRLLVVAGAMLAVGLTFLSVARVSGDGFSYREDELWRATTRVLVTQKGFPEGRAITEDVDAVTRAEQQLGVRFADPERFVGLAVLYSQLAVSDPVRAIAARERPLSGTITAEPVPAGPNAILPMIDVGGIAKSGDQAVRVSKQATEALSTFLTQRQVANDVPAVERVVVQVLARPGGAEIFQARSKTLPVVIFLTTLLATIGLAFILENLRPRVRPWPEKADVASHGTIRRSA